MTPVTSTTTRSRVRPRAGESLLRAATTTVAVLATTSAAGAYAVVATAGTARTRTSDATPAALARVVGPALASLALPDVVVRVTTAIDRQVDRVTALAAQVGTSERLSVAQRARATERLARARTDLFDLRAEVADQTSGEGLARVLDEAHRHRIYWRNWTLEHVPGAHSRSGGRAAARDTSTPGGRVHRTAPDRTRPGAA